MVTRDQLDEWAKTLPMPPVFINGRHVKVNGSLGQYHLWYPKTDKSVLPCLSGEVGGMPGAWENWITAWHYNVLPEFNSYIDIGANGGYYTMLAASQGKQVFSFEANPEYVECLNKTVSDNGYNDTVRVFGVAVTDVDDTISLMVPDDLHGGASVRHGETNFPGNEVEVDGVKIDTLFRSRTPIGTTLIKMDIEGAEQMAFRGAKGFNERIRPTYVIEYTPRHYDGFWEELEEYGVITKIGFDGIEAPVTKQEAESTEDWITLVVRPWE